MKTLFQVLFLALLAAGTTAGIAAERSQTLVPLVVAAEPAPESTQTVPAKSENDSPLKQDEDSRLETGDDREPGPNTSAERDVENQAKTEKTQVLRHNLATVRARRLSVSLPSGRLPVVEGSLLAPEINQCAACHAKSDQWEEAQLRLHVAPESLAEDVHWRHGVNCHDCHGGDPTSLEIAAAHSTQVSANSEIAPFRSPLVNVKQRCGHCHQEQFQQLGIGSHSHAGEKLADGSNAVLGCAKCHGLKAHGMLPVDDSRSPVFLDHQLRTCGDCHEKELKTYQSTVHGRGLDASGLTVTAVCADCHGAHSIFAATDQHSALHPMRVAGTCGDCHRFLEKHVHGRVGDHGQTIDEAGPAEDGKPKRLPSCTDCHFGHHLLEPKQAPFRMQLTSRCGNCHAEQSSSYAMSLHGELTQFGFKPAATCSDCHGAHVILPLDDPHSPLRADVARADTCRKCHVNAVKNFSQFDPHANYKDRENYPLLNSVYYWMKVLFYSFFAFFLVHSILWFVRSFVQTLRHGRHQSVGTGQFALLRYDTRQRVFYAILFFSFLGLIVTGMPLKYSNQPWAQVLAHSLGGIETTSFWHHFLAAVTMAGCAAYVTNGIGNIFELRKKNVSWGKILFGPDSRLPTLRDAKDLLGMGRWFLGLGARPRFERWTYWEKFDYWAVYLTTIVIGLSGLMLWYPNLFCRVLPGQALNVAKVVHEEISILAASFLFMFHFYNTHFRPEKFPVNLTALTGLVSEEHLRKYRPDYVERLFREGRLDEMRRPSPSHGRLWLTFLAGAAMLLLGLCLLALVLLAALGK